MDAIRRDVSWLGYNWNGGEFYTSDHFDRLYGFAVKLIEHGKAYIDHQTAEEMAAQPRVGTSPGQHDLGLDQAQVRSRCRVSVKFLNLHISSHYALKK